MFDLISNINVVEAILIFLATTASDILWVFYIRRTGEGKAVAAAAFSASIVLLGGLVVLAYVGNTWYLIPAAFGAFVGTLITIKFDLRNKKFK
ncbi:hypothetical protein HZB93_04805 [Candidatus Falkowbacteria bacterium]|nr:hypothetical protein [Candidatus Falkowbacteria bacterium]